MAQNGGADPLGEEPGGESGLRATGTGVAAGEHEAAGNHGTVGEPVTAGEHVAVGEQRAPSSTGVTALATRVPASTWETVDELVAAVVDVDRAIHAMTAWRTELIDQARRLGEAVQHATQTPLSSAADIPRRTMVAELACALRTSERAMNAEVDSAQMLVDRLPATLAAMRRGDLSARHADVIIQNTADLDPTDRADAEQHLVDLGTRQSVARFRSTARRWRERHHPRDLTERHQEAREKRCVVLDPASDGMAWFSALLPAPQAWAMFDRVDAATATLRGDDEPRTAAQLRADVLADLVLDPAAAAVLAGEDVRSPHRPGVQARVHVTVPVLTLLGKAEEPGHLEGYGPIDPDTARELAAGAPSFTRLLTHPETGAVLSVGRDRYTVPSGLRRYLRLRDETCRFPGCGRGAARCDVDHTVAWQHGGTTSSDNLAHLCRHHHRLKHEGGWIATAQPGGTLDWASPAGRHYETDPALPSDPALSIDPTLSIGPTREPTAGPRGRPDTGRTDTHRAESGPPEPDALDPPPADTGRTDVGPPEPGAREPARRHDAALPDTDVDARDGPPPF